MISANLRLAPVTDDLWQLLEGGKVMRLSVEMDNVYGGSCIECYSIVVRGSDDWVWFELFNNDTQHMQKGGTFMVPIEVAKKLGEALITMSASSSDGLPTEIKLTFDESQPDLTSSEQP
jgi:hypothetical protein